MKTLKSVILGCLIAFLPVQNSSATLALIGSGPATYTFANLSVLPLGVGLYLFKSDEGCKNLLCYLGAAASLSVGIIFLDDNGSNPSFTSVSDEDAKNIGLTKSEQKSFNSSLEEINMIKNEIVLELAELKNPTVSDADKMWEENSDLLDVDAFNALNKVKASIKASIQK